MAALDNCFGAPAHIFPQYIRKLMKPDTYTYDSNGLRRMRETLHRVVKGMENCKGYNADTILGGILISRLDKQASHEWNSHEFDSTKLPTHKEVIDFFKKRETGLYVKQDAINKTSQSSNASNAKSHPAKKPAATTPAATRSINRVNAEPPFNCPACNKSVHPISKCAIFQSWSPDKRHKAIQEANLCFNCFSHSHQLKDCKSPYSCRLCKQKHHTLLHQESAAKTESTSNAEAVNHVESPKTALLATMMTRARSNHCHQDARALLDTGSTLTLITKRLASALRLKRHPERIEFTGMGGKSVSRHYVYINLCSTHPGSSSKSTVSAKCHVVPRLDPQQPPANPHRFLNLPCIRGKSPLADPDLGGPIDLLLGIGDWIKCVESSITVRPGSEAIAIPTIFGWALSGVVTGAPVNTVMQIRSETDSLDAVLGRLYDMDQVSDPDLTSLSSAEQSAVEQFEDTYKVLPSGQFAVKLPRVDNPPLLEDSRPAALKRFLQNERYLKRKERLPEFEGVLNEYLELEHAEPLPTADLSKPASQAYYMPVHGVIKDASTTTKLRAVFDASNKTASGVSLNDTLLPGPNRYPLIATILNRFRLHQVAASADISKMFREIVLQPEERDFHRFLLRDEKGTIIDCRMKRLTFGVTSSPYLATQVLLKLAELNQHTYPTAAKLIKSSFYVDDCLTGADTVKKMTRVREELCTLLAKS